MDTDFQENTEVTANGRNPGCFQIFLVFIMLLLALLFRNGTQEVSDADHESLTLGKFCMRLSRHTV